MEDDAAIRRVTAAADRVLESLSELGSSADIESLLKYFQVLSRDLLLLNGLTLERAHSLQDPRQTGQLLDSLETLRRCISMLHTAMCTTIKHPTNEQAQEAKRYILDRVQSAVGDIVLTLRSERPSGSLGACGYYTEKRNGALQLLATSCTSTVQKSGFDSLVRDLVFHCMAVANSSRRRCQQKLVGHCRRILHLWSDMKTILTSLVDPDDNVDQDFLKTSSLLAEQIEMLDETLMTALVYHILDTFTTASSTIGEILNMAGQIPVAHSPEKVDLNCVQPLVEDLISYTDQLMEVARFVSAVALDAKSLENMENSRMCLKRLRAQMEPLSLELADDSVQSLQKLCIFCRVWEEEASQFQDTLSDVVDVKEFTSLAINEMVDDRRGCDEAFREQNYSLFDEHAAKLVSHMKLVARSVRRFLDRSHDPIYRNGLLVLLKQAQSVQSKVAGSVREMLFGSTINVSVYTPFSDNVAEAIKQFKVLRQGLDGQQHPHLLSPLREGARKPEIPQICLPSGDTPEQNPDQIRIGTATGSLVLEAEESDPWAEREEEEEQQLSDDETVEAELARICDTDDLSLPAVSAEPWPTNKSLEFDLLPLLYEVVTVTKGKDVTALNRACTGILELSNCYAQSAKEALAVVDAIDGQTLEGFRAELVSLTPLLVHTAQETAMSSVMSTESLYKHSVLLSDLVSNTRKVLLPAAGNWYHAVYTELQPNLPTKAASVRLQLNEVAALCTDTVQLLTSSDITSQNEAQETFGALHNKLNKAQNHTRCLLEFSASAGGRTDHLEGLCILWGLSIQILLKSLDRILGTSSAINQLSPQKQLSTLSENSLRIQEAARLTSLNCRSAHKSKQLRAYQDELKILTDSYLKAAEALDSIPNVLQLAKVEFLMRQLIIKIRVLLGYLSKANKDFDAALQSLVAAARLPAGRSDENLDDAEEDFEKAAETLSECVKLAIKRVEDSLNYFRDPRARSNLRSINDHLSFQILDITSRLRLMVETRYVCDTLCVDVQVQCWSAKAHYVVEEIRKQDEIHREAKEQIRAGLQGQAIEVAEESSAFKVNDVEIQTSIVESVDATEQNVSAAAWMKKEPEHRVKDVGILSLTNYLLTTYASVVLTCLPCQTIVRYGALKEAFSLTSTSLFLKKESDSWDPQNNRIVQVTRNMADTICYLTQYLRKRGPILVRATRGHFVNLLCFLRRYQQSSFFHPPE